MKFLRILSHPYTLIVCYLFIVISGESMGGFYVMYILLGLLHGVVHSLLGFFGVLVLFITHHLAFRQQAILKPLLNCLGLALMIASLFVFFNNDTAHYNWGTFEQGVPLFTLVVTGLVAVCFLVGSFWRPRPDKDLEHGFFSRV